MTMLQFSGILFNSSVRHKPRVPLWLTTQQLVAANSTIPNPNLGLDSVSSSVQKKIVPLRKTSQKKEPKQAGQTLDMRSLFSIENKNNEVEKLLSSVDSTKITSEYSLNIISKLSDLVNQGKAEITDFDSDGRYKALCNHLSGKPRKKSHAPKLTDSVEHEIQNTKQQLYEKKLGFFFDMNEIQKMAEDPNMSIHKATQIMSKLAFHKSRVVPVLESLANHIVNNNRQINIKTASDILYNIASLNFYNEVLISKIAEDLMSQIPKTDKQYSAVIGSILKSIGLLRYRDEKLLMHLSTWMLENSKSTRPQDICSFLVTLAITDYSPQSQPEMFKDFTQNLKEADMSEADEWLDVVWALVVLNHATETQVLSVLDMQFVERLSAVSAVSESKKRKLLNINAAAKHIFKNDTGQFSDQSAPIFDVTLERSKEKQEFVKGIVTALYALLPSRGCLKTNINTGMGFPLDVEFYVDKNCNPVLLDKVKSKEKTALRIAVLPQSYYDFCRGDQKLIGPVLFQSQLLKLSGYHVIPVPYIEFNSDRKVVERVKYLKDKIKETVDQFYV